MSYRNWLVYVECRGWGWFQCAMEHTIVRTTDGIRVREYPRHYFCLAIRQRSLCLTRLNFAVACSRVGTCSAVHQACKMQVQPMLVRMGLERSKEGRWNGLAGIEYRRTAQRAIARMNGSRWANTCFGLGGYRKKLPQERI